MEATFILQIEDPTPRINVDGFEPTIGLTDSATVKRHLACMSKYDVYILPGDMRNTVTHLASALSKRLTRKYTVTRLEGNLVVVRIK
jgi:hypothetical protein